MGDVQTSGELGKVLKTVSKAGLQLSPEAWQKAIHNECEIAEDVHKGGNGQLIRVVSGPLNQRSDEAFKERGHARHHHISELGLQERLHVVQHTQDRLVECKRRGGDASDVRIGRHSVLIVNKVVRQHGFSYFVLDASLMGQEGVVDTRQQLVIQVEDHVESNLLQLVVRDETDRHLRAYTLALPTGHGETISN